MAPKQTNHSDISANPHKHVLPYQQVANILRAQILSIAADRPVRLTAQRQLCQIHQVSRETIRNALRALEADGLIARRPGQITVTDPGGIRAWRRLHQARRIAIVTSGTSDSIVPGTFYGDILQAIIASAEAAGYSSLLRPTGRPFPGIRAKIEPEDSQDILGVILVGIHDEDVVRMHAQAGRPVVAVDYWSPDRRVDAVVADCFGEGQQAARFLLELGHRHLFYAGNLLHDASSRYQHETDADLLLAGFARALRNADVDLPTERIFFCFCHPRNVRELVQQVAGLRPRPTAGLIFQAGTFVLFREYLGQAGLACPRDMSLLCKASMSDDLDAAALRVDPRMMGQSAVQLLLERAGGKRQQAVCLALRSTLHGDSTVRFLH